MSRGKCCSVGASRFSAATRHMCSRTRPLPSFLPFPSLLTLEQARGVCTMPCALHVRAARHGVARPMRARLLLCGRQPERHGDTVSARHLLQFDGARDGRRVHALHGRLLLRRGRQHGADGQVRPWLLLQRRRLGVAAQQLLGHGRQLRGGLHLHARRSFERARRVERLRLSGGLLLRGRRDRRDTLPVRHLQPDDRPGRLRHLPAGLLLRLSVALLSTKAQTRTDAAGASTRTPPYRPNHVSPAVSRRSPLPVAPAASPSR